MDSQEAYDYVSEELNVTQQEFEGDEDEADLVSGYGEQRFLRDYLQKYEGQFLYNNLHGEGKYTWLLKNFDGLIYDDLFYANNLEGYSSVYYKGCGLFEGLFKRNQRYGPGVYTYDNGQQDVGLWDNYSLIRLCRLINPCWIPHLGHSESGKIKLLKYRKLVSLEKESIDLGKKVMEDLDAPQKLLDDSHVLYNKYVRHPDSNLFDKVLYDEVFFGKEDCAIDVIASDADIDELTGISDKMQDEVLGYKIVQDYNEEEGQEDFLHEDISFFEDTSTYAYQEKVLNKTRDTFRKMNLKEGHQENEVKSKTILITDILAWNNEPHFLDMIKHCFRHRHMEGKVSFGIEQLLKANRKCFHEYGVYEKACCYFLLFCSEGRELELLQLASDYVINPDLCDSRGNTGMLFGAARDRVTVINNLLNLGANVDSINDEGLTPLTVSILRYLATENKATNWEKAFVSGVVIKPEEKKQVDSWNVYKSICSLTNTSVVNQESIVSQTPSSISGIYKSQLLNVKMHDELSLQDFQTPYFYTLEEQNYLLNTNCVVIPIERKRDEKKKPKEKKKKEKRRKKSPRKSKKIEKTEEDLPKEEVIPEIDLEIKAHLKIVRNTIMVLLQSGADPNIGEVPMPALILSVFTNELDILKGLIRNKADLDVTTLEENLTALHVLASLNPTDIKLDMFEVLLDNQANPNCKSNSYHWMDQKSTILGKIDEKIEDGFNLDEEKTPLHILGMRYDYLRDQNGYLNKMATLLLYHNADSEALYLGHTALTLAILRGNVKLVQDLLEGGVDSNVRLGANMGVPLTVLVLKRYYDYLPLELCRNIFDLLLKHNANPLKTARIDENAVEFMIKEHEVVETVEVNKKGKPGRKKKKKKGSSKSSKTKKTKKSSSKSSKRSSKKSKKGQIGNQDEIKTMLLNAARATLLRFVQAKAVAYLYEFFYQDVYDKDILEAFGKFVTPSEALRILQVLIHAEKIYVDNDTKLVCSDLIDSVKECHPIVSEQVDPETEDMISTLDFSVQKNENTTNIDVEIDPLESKYKVCFHCCRKAGKLLFPCPKCGLIYFCSDECNYLNNKMDNKHSCGLLFYNSEKDFYDQCLKDGVEYVKHTNLTSVLNKLKNKLTKPGSAILLKGGFFVWSAIKLRRRESRRRGFHQFEEARQKGKRSKSSSYVDGKLKTSKKSKKRIGSASETSDEYDEKGRKLKKSKRKEKDLQEDRRSKKVVSLRMRDLDSTAEKVKGKYKRELSQESSDEEKVKSRRKAKTKGKSYLSEDEDEKGTSRKASKSKKGKQKYSSDDDEDVEERGKSRKSRAIKGKRGKQKYISDDEEDDGRRRSNKDYTRKKEKSGKIINKKPSGRDSDENQRRKITTDRDKQRSRSRSLGPLPSEKRTGSVSTGKSDVSGRFDLHKPTKLTLGSVLSKTDQRFPRQYQYYFERLLELFPELDLSTLLLPYACFKDGQLYYRFMDSKFYQTYSHV